MALELPFGVKTVNPVAVDFWSGPYSGVLTQEAVNAANSGIPSGVRFVSMEASLIVNGVSQKYWYASGTDDLDLIPFAGGGDVTTQELLAVSGIAVYGSGHTLQTVTDNGNTTTNEIIINNNFSAVSGSLSGIDFTPLFESGYPPHLEGRLFYDADNHTVSLYVDEPDVTLQLGQEEFLRVRNNHTYPIQNGSGVYIDGSQGTHPTIDFAIASGEALSQVIGVATHDIEPLSFGYVTTYGTVRGLDTSAFSDGEEIFLSATASGTWTNVSPIAPNYKAPIGHVIRSHPTAGTILVVPESPKLGGGDIKTLGQIQQSGIAFFDVISDDPTAGILVSDSNFYYDSGSDRVYVGSGGIAFSDGTIQVTAPISQGTYFTGPAYAIWTGTGLTFDVIYPVYFLDGKQYPGGNEQVTLPSGDSTYDRFDAIIVDSGGANSIQGLPEANPVFPQTDLVNELLVTYVEIPTSGTVPGNISEKIIYDENVEWVGSGNLTNLDFADTTDPKFGSVHTSFDGFNNGSLLQYDDGGAPTLVNSFGLLRFYLKLGASLTTNRYLTVQFYRAGLPVSNAIGITDGNYNYDRTDTAYQLIVVPLSDFAFSGPDFDSLHFGFNGSTATTIYLDYISLQTDVGSQPQPDFFRYIITDDGIIFANQPNDALRIINSNKTGDKEITIPGASGNRVYSNITSDISMFDSDDVIFADSTSNPINVYIPTAINTGGKEITIKMAAGTKPVTVIASGAETIDGQGSFSLLHTYQSITLLSNNSNWFII